MAKLLARHVRAVRARDPGWAPGLPVTPHTLRRSRAMHLIQAGVNLIYIRDLLGHADVSTTEIYARADAETKRKAIENAYQPLTPDILPDWTSDTSLVGWLTRWGGNTGHYADENTTGAAPTSRNTYRRITPLPPNALRPITTFAVNNLRFWFAQGQDVGALLPVLQTYMGHSSLADTAYYLHLTAESYPDITTRVQQAIGDIVPPVMAGPRHGH